MGAEMGFTMKRKIKWKVVVAAGAAVIAVGVIANVVFRYFRYDAYNSIFLPMKWRVEANFRRQRMTNRQFPAWSWLRKTIH